MSIVTLRLPDDLKQRLQTMAESRGESLNHYIESIAVQALVAEETARRIRLRREQGSPAKALAVLDRVPDRAPQRGDARSPDVTEPARPARRKAPKRAPGTRAARPRSKP